MGKQTEVNRLAEATFMLWVFMAISNNNRRRLDVAESLSASWGAGVDSAPVIFKARIGRCARSCASPCMPRCVWLCLAHVFGGYLSQKDLCCEHTASLEVPLPACSAWHGSGPSLAFPCNTDLLRDT